MPVKMRRPKARTAVPAEKWAGVFTHGRDFLGDLRPWGLIEPCHAHPLPGPEREAAEEVWESAIREAWRIHGRSFLATWRPSGVRALPWALEAYGEPDGCL